MRSPATLSIDPLLRELGWDTEDPSLVIPEYQSGQSTRFADYALLEGSDDKPAMMVEAKSLGRSLRDQALLQGINYCQAEGTKYFSVTDGQRWEVYETHKPVPIEQKRVVEFDLKDPSSPAVCLKVLALWRPTVQTGQVVGGEESIFSPPEESSVPPPTTVKDDLPTPPEEEYNWEPLTEITAEKGEKPPIELQLPDGSKVALQFWYSLMTEPTRWLLNNSHLTPSQLPIQSASKYLVSLASNHPSGSSMKQGKEVSGIWLETSYTGSGCVKNAISIIEHVGQDPSQFSVRFS